MNKKHKIQFDIDSAKMPKTVAPIETVLEGLKLDVRYRSMKQVEKIASFINKTEISRKLKADLSNTTSLDKQLLLTSAHMEYTNLPREEPVFRFGDEGDKFYIILEGSVCILKPYLYQIEMHIEEYLDHLIELYHKKEKGILKLTATENKKVFPFNLEHLARLPELLIKIKLKTAFVFEPTVDSLNHIFTRFGVPLSKFNLNLKELQENEGKGNTSHSTYNSLIYDKLQDLTLGDNYDYIEKMSGIRVTVGTFRYKKVLEIHSGSYFGDLALESTGVRERNATIVGVAEETHLGFVDQQTYRENIEAEKMRQRQKEVLFLTENFYFQNIGKPVFHRHYFHNFVLKKYPRSSFLLRQGGENKKLFFIKEGELQLTINMSIFDLQIALEELEKISGVVKKREYKMYFEPKNHLEDLNKKQEVKLTDIQNLESIGLEHAFIDIPWLFSAKVKSDYLTCYELDFESNNNILSKEKLCRTVFKENALYRLNLLYERLVRVKNSKLEILDERIKIDNLLKKKEMKAVRDKEHETTILNSAGIPRHAHKFYIHLRKSGLITRAMSLSNITKAKIKVNSARAPRTEKKNIYRKPKLETITEAIKIQDKVSPREDSIDSVEFAKEAMRKFKKRNKKTYFKPLKEKEIKADNSVKYFDFDLFNGKLHSPKAKSKVKVGFLHGNGGKRPILLKVKREQEKHLVIRNSSV